MEYRELKLLTEKTYCGENPSPGEAISNNSWWETSNPIPEKNHLEKYNHVNQKVKANKCSAEECLEVISSYAFLKGSK